MARMSMIQDEFEIEKFLKNDETDDENDTMDDSDDSMENFVDIIFESKKHELKENLRQAVMAWAKIGVPPRRRRQRCSVLDEYLTNCFEEIGKTENFLYEECCRYRTEKLLEINIMLGDLNLPPYMADDNLSLYQICRRLMIKHCELNKVKQERLERLEELRKRQIQFCQKLGIQQPSGLKLLGSFPSESELMEFQTTVSDLEVELKRRQSKLDHLKEMIATLFKQLEYKPQNDFEKNCLSVYDLSEKYLQATIQFHLKLEMEFSQNQKKFHALKDRLNSLYTMLDIPLEERNLFLNENFECRPSVIKLYEIEVENYERLKRENMSKFIEKCLEQISIWYDKCYIDNESRVRFSCPQSVTLESGSVRPAIFDELNGDEDKILQACEEELQRIQEYYKENKTLLEKFAEWQGMWLKLIDLEARSNDPNRLKNRGGQLLIEENERKKLQVSLPKIQNQLKELTKNSGKKFSILGVEVEKFIEGCWDELHEAKEIEKLERRRVKNTPTTRVQTRNKRPVNFGSCTPTKVQRVGVTPTKVQRVGCTPSKLQRTCTTIRFQGPTNIPVPNRATPGINKTVNHHADETSVLSINEQEFEKAVKACPTSARRARQQDY